MGMEKGVKTSETSQSDWCCLQLKELQCDHGDGCIQSQKHVIWLQRRRKWGRTDPVRYFSILWDGSDGFDMLGSTAKGARMFYGGGTVHHGVPVENEGESRFKI